MTTSEEPSLDYLEVIRREELPIGAGFQMSLSNSQLPTNAFLFISGQITYSSDFASLRVRSAVKNSSAFSAKEMSPACGLAA
jgi:hypothetical protein